MMGQPCHRVEMFVVAAAIAVWLGYSANVRAVDGYQDNAALRATLESGVAAYDTAQGLLGTDPERSRQLFDAAAQQFESIASSGIESGPLEYNLGNCYLQAGNTGKAILHYRRALRLMPNDSKLHANLREARRRCLTSITPSRERRFLHEIFSWHYQTAPSQRWLIAVFSYVVFWIGLAGRSMWRRRWITVATGVAALLAVACGASLAVADWQARNEPAGVVTALDVPVNKGPGTGYPRQFEQPLQPGTEFDRIGRRGGWWEIELPDGKSGWINAENAELVRGNKS